MQLAANIKPSAKMHGGRGAQCAKRILDVTVSAIALLLFSPVLLLIALAVRLGLGAPVLFRQKRAGLHGQDFTILKFRTMTNERDAAGVLLSDAERLHALGKFLRTSSLDELPQLFNVLRGEMSLVGPRPLLPQYVARYTPGQARRLLAKPGITGWVQVKGRNAMEWDEKFALDVWYVDNWGFWLDVKILLQTIVVVVGAQGTAREGHATMPEFKPWITAHDDMSSGSPEREESTSVPAH